LQSVDAEASAISLMKKILIVSYYFPPSIAPGAVRPSKFARYLPQFGWYPIVLTTPPADMSESMIPSETGEVHRVKEWRHPLKTYEGLRSKLAQRKGREDEHIARRIVSHSVATAPPRTRGLAELKRWLLAFLWLPDQEVTWVIPAVWRGIGLIRKNQVSYLLTTGPPFSCHLIGLALKRLTGVTWVADFRDPWSLNDKFPIFRNQATDAIESHLIRTVMKNADLVLSVTPPMTQRAGKEHADLDPGKFVTLTSGFDPADFHGLSTAHLRAGPILFSYLGTFYHGRTPVPFLRALSGLIDDGLLKRTDVLVKFVGHVARAEGQSVQEMVSQLRLEDIVSMASAVPRYDALRLTVESDVVLVLDEQHPAQIPMKLYEAMAAGTIVFNIGSRGAVSEVLAKTGCGISADHTNIDEIRHGILECIRKSRSEETRRNPEPWASSAIQAFNFQKLTGTLTELLENLDPMKMSDLAEQRAR
jgi:glycosyltransferase involved in cell wall biosynthesis